MSRKKEDKDKKKRQQNELEAMIFAILEKSMKDCLKAAMKDIFDGFPK